MTKFSQHRHLLPIGFRLGSLLRGAGPPPAGDLVRGGRRAHEVIPLFSGGRQVGRFGGSITKKLNRSPYWFLKVTGPTNKKPEKLHNNNVFSR
jgi:hypothetical protein